MCSNYQSINKLVKELKDLMLNCKQTLLYIKKLEKQAHNKDVKPWSYNQIKKFNLIANILKQNKIRNSKSNSLSFFKFYILWVNDLIR